MLSCQQITELVTEYLEGKMDAERRLEFDKHMGLCRHCRVYLKQMQSTVDMMGKLPDEPVPDGVMAELQQTFKQWNE